MFIRNLPYTATAADLEELCGSVGPVKRASIIQSPDGQSRGFGFVKFALPEDASRAAAILNHAPFQGRTLAIELAMKKGQKPANVPESKVKEKNKKESKEEGKKKPKDDKKEQEPDDEKSPQQQQQQQQVKKVLPKPVAGKAGKKKETVVMSKQPSRTLIAFNVAEQTTEKQLYKRIKKIAVPSKIKTEVGPRVIVYIEL